MTMLIALAVVAAVLFGVYKSSLSNTLKAVAAVVVVALGAYVAFGGQLGLKDPMPVEKIDQQGGH